MLEALESDTSVVYSRADDEFSFTGEKSDRDHFVEAIRVFFDHGKIAIDDVPYQTQQARKNYILNIVPEHNRGGKCIVPRKSSPACTRRRGCLST